MEKINTTQEAQQTIGNRQASSFYLYAVFIICFISGVFGGVTSTLMSSYLPVAIKDILGETSQGKSDDISALINAIFLFGMMFGGMIMGVLEDRIGRKKSVIISSAAIGLFTFLTALSHSWLQVLLTRFFTGFGVGGILVTSTILIAEIWPVKNRAVALGILSITIPVGIFSAGIITYYFSNWRTGFLIGIIPLILSLISIWIIKESDSFLLIQKEKKSRVKHRENSVLNKETWNDIMGGIIIYGTMLIGLWAVFAWLPTWVQTLIKTGDGQKERGTSMMLFAAGGLSGGFISGWISNVLGMRKTMLICFAACFILSFILFKLNTSFSSIIYLEMAMLALFFGISQGVLNDYIPELFPTSVRASATGLCFNTGRLFTATVVFFVGWLVNLLGGYGNAIFIFSFIFLVVFISVLYSREKHLLNTK